MTDEQRKIYDEATKKLLGISNKPVIVESVDPVKVENENITGEEAKVEETKTDKEKSKK